MVDKRFYFDEMSDSAAPKMKEFTLRLLAYESASGKPAPGCGKTTLAHQIMFANATPQKPALYFTVLGEPALKMLRYQQQYSFFDPAKLNTAIRFINLSEAALEKDLSGVLEEIQREVQASNPSMVVVDSFRNVVCKALGEESKMQLQDFVQRVALFLSSWQATTFLIGEYSEPEVQGNPVFTVADGLFCLTQNVERNSSCVNCKS